MLEAGPMELGTILGLFFFSARVSSDVGWLFRNVNFGTNASAGLRYVSFNKICYAMLRHFTRFT